jgi:hypothetical protein
MATREEDDFPAGHPARGDYNPLSAEAKEWARTHYAPMGERDFPVGHPKAQDTPGNQNRVQHLAGVDPQHPELEPFSGRTPEQVEALAQLNRELAKTVKETEPRKPIIAPPPPEPIDRPIPTGQPGDE